MSQAAPIASTASAASRLRAWAELTRISNLPTVISNVWVGGAFAWWIRSTAVEPRQIWGALALAALAISLIYLGGMVLNDVCDVATDRRERPQRPIPAGLVAWRSALLVSAAAVISGPLLLLPCNPLSAGLAAVLSLMVVVYNLTHARWSASIFIMGLCRALIYPTVLLAAIGDNALDVAGHDDWLLLAVPFYVGGLLGAYVAMFALVARAERGGARLVRWPALVIPVWPLPFLITGVLGVPAESNWIRPWAIAAYIAYLLWTVRAVWRVYARPPRVVPAVLTWLTGICLFDCCLASWSGNPWFVAGPAVCFAITVWGHRRVLGT